MSSNCPSIVTEFVLQMRQLVVVEKDMPWELQHPCHENYWLRMKQTPLLAQYFHTPVMPV